MTVVSELDSQIDAVANDHWVNVVERFELQHYDSGYTMHPDQVDPECDAIIAIKITSCAIVHPHRDTLHHHYPGSQAIQCSPFSAHGILMGFNVACRTRRSTAAAALAMRARQQHIFDDMLDAGQSSL